MNECRRKPPVARGFTLLEVLVTLMIMSVGLLGLATLQFRSLQYTHSGYHRTWASIQVQDLEDRFWLAYGALPANTDPAAGPLLAVINDWIAHYRDSLPPCTGEPCREVVRHNVGNHRFEYRVTIRWRDSRFSDHDTILSYRFRLPELGRVP